MAQKTVSLNEIAYNLLKNAKENGESYSEVIERRFSAKGKEGGSRFAPFFGTLDEDDDWDMIEKHIYGDRIARSKKKILRLDD